MQDITPQTTTQPGPGRRILCDLCWASVGKPCTVSGPPGDDLAWLIAAVKLGLIGRAELAEAHCGRRGPGRSRRHHRACRMSTDGRVQAAKEFLSAARSQKVKVLPYSVLMREDAELRPPARRRPRVRARGRTGSRATGADPAGDAPLLLICDEPVLVDVDDHVRHLRQCALSQAERHRLNPEQDIIHVWPTKPSGVDQASLAHSSTFLRC